MEEEISEMLVQKLTETAHVPERKTTWAGGFDLYTDEAVRLASGKWTLASTGISVALPHGFVGLVKARSSTAIKKGIDVFEGVIDEDYRGEIKIGLRYLNGHDIIVDEGVAIAQLVVVPYWAIPARVVDELPSTGRGSGGFGSTDHAK